MARRRAGNKPHRPLPTDEQMSDATYTRGCSGKIGLPSRRQAMGVVRVMRKRPDTLRGWLLQVYKCRHCGLHHVGHA